MKNFALSFLLFFPIISFCQQNDIYPMPVFEFGNNTETYIFTQHSKVRAQPSVNASIQDSLQMGELIIILSQTDSVSSIAGKRARWYKIRYTKNEQSFEGFTWGGNLCMLPLRRGNIKFLFGFKGTIKAIANEAEIEVMLAECKALRNDSLISSINFEFDSPDYLSFATAKIENSKGFPSAEYLLHMSISGEACGVPTIEQYVLWQKNTLIKLPLLYSVADGGEYYHGEQFVFPSEKNGKSNTLIRRIEDFDESKNKKAKITTEIFQWDGNTFKKVK